MEERQQLVSQIAQLQLKLKQLDLEQRTTPTRTPSPSGSSSSKGRPRTPVGPLPPALAAQPKRHIALQFVYDGRAHSGLAYQPSTGNAPKLSTVEGELLDALETARLIEPMQEIDGFGCGFERCGRTDAGVSSSAQVINLWVRSQLKDPMGTGTDADVEAGSSTVEGDGGQDADQGVPVIKKRPSAPVEMPYITILNRLLPPSIRIIAWSPVSANFSSRYSCIWRHYKYFFSTSVVDPFLRPRIDNGSAYPPFGRNPDGTEGEPAEWQKRLDKINWDGLVLDVELMKEAASKLVGDHDFRNFCKIDAPKQLSTHRRTVISATIDPVEGEGPDMFVFNLRGGAFLYNQVRHIVAMLFMIGARLESPDIIGKLLWTSDRSPQTIDMHAPASDETREILDRKPGYGMADDLPLVLWQCGYNSSELAWRTDNAPREGDVAYQSATEEELALAAKQALDPVETFKREFLELNQIWTEQRLKSIIVRHHLHALATHAPAPPEPSSSPSRKKPLVYTPHGAGQYFKSSGHIPMMRRQRADLPEEINRKWAEGRGAVKMARRAANQEQADALRVINLAKKEEARRLAEESEEKHGFGSWGTKGGGFVG